MHKKQSLENAINTKGILAGVTAGTLRSITRILQYNTNVKEFNKDMDHTFRARKSYITGQIIGHFIEAGVAVYTAKALISYLIR